MRRGTVSEVVVDRGVIIGSYVNYKTKRRGRYLRDSRQLDSRVEARQAREIV